METEPLVERRPSRRGAQGWLLFLVVLAGAGFFWRVTGYPFLQWDDPVYVTSRPALHQIGAGQLEGLRQLLSPAQALSGDFWEYFPARDLSYAIDAWRGGMRPGPFHQTNLLLHLVAAALLWLLARRLSCRPLFATLAGLLFCLHPLAVEPVAWVSARKDLLYVALTLAALLSLSHGLAAESRWRSWLALAAFHLLALSAMASKGPGVLVVPLAAWLVCALPRPRWRRGWIALIPVAAVMVLWLLATLAIGWRNGILKPSPAGLGGGLFRAIGAPLREVLAFALPLELSPSRGSWPFAWWMDPHTWASLLLGCLLVLRARAGRLVRSHAMFLLGGVILASLPGSGLVAVTQERADRFSYLALAMIALLAAYLLQRASTVRPRLALLGLGLLSALALRANGYLEVWRDDLRLWTYVHRQDPDNAYASGSLGALALERGHLDLAKRLLERSLRSDPRLAVTWANLGLWWQHSSDATRAGASDRREAARASAERAFRRALELDPRRGSALVGLGQLAQDRGDAGGAERWFRRALTLPGSARRSARLLADLLREQGRRPEAQAIISEALARYPGDPDLQRWSGGAGSIAGDRELRTPVAPPGP